jgi:hypothetical protein
MLRRPIWQLWLLPVIGVAAVLLLLLAPIGFGSSEFSRAAENFCHAPLFALVAIGCLIWLRNCHWPTSLVGQYLAALLFAVLLGAIGEIAQSFTVTRDAEWFDLGNDFLGAGTGLCIYRLYDRQHPLRTKPWVAVCCVFVLTVLLVAPLGQTAFMYWQRWRQLPELATWGSPAGYHFVKPGSAALRVARLPLWSSGSNEIALEVRPLPEDRWVGTTIDEPWPDWSDYSQLVIDVVNPNDVPLSLIIRVHDRAHNNEYADRFNRRFEIAPRQRVTLSTALTDVRAAPKSRQLDLTHIAGIVIFQDAQRGASSFYICSVRLAR